MGVNTYSGEGGPKTEAAHAFIFEWAFTFAKITELSGHGYGCSWTSSNSQRPLILSEQIAFFSCTKLYKTPWDLFG